MNITKHMHEIYDVFTNDETLLRLLVYPSKNLNDSPLDKNKENILDKEDKWELIDDRIKFLPTTEGFDGNEICRICYYADIRSKDRRNKNSRVQDIKFDVLTHHNFHEVDLRAYLITERISDLLKNGKFSSFGKVEEEDGKPLGNVAEGYIGYRTIYRFGELYDK